MRRDITHREPFLPRAQFSSYDFLRRSDNTYYINATQYIQFGPNQVKINSSNRDSLIGTDGDDSFSANYYAAYNGIYFNTDLLVKFYAGGGNDLMGGSSRNDTLWGGTGNDALWGYEGNDTLYGEEGNDELIGGAGNDLLDGGTGDDMLFAEAGNDTLIGGEGNDELQAGDGNDALYGGAGHDRLFGQAGDDNDTVLSSISHTLGAQIENLGLLDFSKPEKGVADGVDILVYGYPKANELDYMQGNAVRDYAGTCALTSIANLAIQANQNLSEAQVVQRAIDNQWCVTDSTVSDYERGGSNYLGQRALLDSYGIRNGLMQGYNEQGIANLIKGGRGVIIAVNAGKLWGEDAYLDGGAVNHVVTVTGVACDAATGAINGFYIADSGRGLVSDMTRYLSLEEFRRDANVANAYSIYTIDPIKLRNENIDGTGNELANIITGNRGDNILTGGRGNDTIIGQAGNDSRSCRSFRRKQPWRWKRFWRTRISASSRLARTPRSR